ncbi:MAG TPA: hypothetical protein VK838_00515 [Candidatus Limnocylindrales bacterium]|nr:hypothetical protein [Candidatus Limnocylindrales bacterium]
MRRRPGEGPFRRGSQIDASPEQAGYVPFQPEPEDALAVRPEGESAVYGGPELTDPDSTRPVTPPQPREAPPQAPPAVARAPETSADPGRWPEPAAPPSPPATEDSFDPYAADAADDRPYGEPEDAYAYPYLPPEERGGGGGGGALPIIGFLVLSVLALAVGAVLAGLLGGDNGVGQQSPSPSVASTAPSVAPTQEPTPEPSEPDASATEEPQDGPVAFPDGALYEVQPCGSYDYKRDLSGCVVDGSTRDDGNVWILVVFNKGKGADNLVLELRSGGETLDRQEKELGSVVNCDTCSGLIWGAIYRDLLPGDYQLVLRRNGDFADRATFTVGG